MNDDTLISGFAGSLYEKLRTRERSSEDADIKDAPPWRDLPLPVRLLIIELHYASLREGSGRHCQ